LSLRRRALARDSTGFGCCRAGGGGLAHGMVMTIVVVAFELNRKMGAPCKCHGFAPRFEPRRHEDAANAKDNDNCINCNCAKGAQQQPHLVLNK